MHVSIYAPGWSICNIRCACRLELMEAAGCTLLACTLAWGPAGGLGEGPSDVHAAADAVRAALHSAALPAATAAPAVKVSPHAASTNYPRSSMV